MKHSLMYGSLVFSVLVACAANDATPDDTEPTETPAPEHIPSDYVRAPQAWVHRDCVYEIEEGATVDEGGTIQHADGSVEQVAACAHPSYPVKRAAIADHHPGANLPTYYGWVESADGHAWTGAGAMAANFVVPAPPAVNQGQFIYLFPGMQPDASGEKIIQPVLQWGTSPAGGGPYWAFAGWEVTHNNAYHSTLQWTGTGDTIRGQMTGSGCGVQVCSTWDIKATDLNRGVSTNLHTTGNGYAYQWIAGGALEAYNVTSCSGFPQSYTPFTSVDVRTVAGNLITMSYNNNVWTGGCGAVVYSNGNTVHLHY